MTRGLNKPPYLVVLKERGNKIMNNKIMMAKTTPQERELISGVLERARHKKRLSIAKTLLSPSYSQEGYAHSKTRRVVVPKYTPYVVGKEKPLICHSNKGNNQKEEKTPINRYRFGKIPYLHFLWRKVKTYIVEYMLFGVIRFVQKFVLSSKTKKGGFYT